MIITKTPFRVSFFGGGTDYPEHFETHGGAVLGTAIDYFAYMSCTRFLSRLFDYNIRLSYRQVECVSSLEELQHVPFRECLRWCNIDRDIEIDYTAELPSFSGLGSSSTFVVGLVNALHAHQSKAVLGLDLAYEAIRIERERLKEAVGCQDQVFAAMGGFNVVEFRRTDDISVHRIPLSMERMRHFEEHLLIFYTGLKRRAVDLAAKQIKKMPHNKDRLIRMRKLVDDAYTAIINNGSLHRFGDLLHQSWCEKRELDASIQTESISQTYEIGKKAGALGGKLLGAGGGGFFLFFVPKEKQAAVRKALGHLQEISIRVNAAGSHVIHS